MFGKTYSCVTILCVDAKKDNNTKRGTVPVTLNLISTMIKNPFNPCTHSKEITVLKRIGSFFVFVLKPSH